MGIGERIKQARLAEGLSQDALANQLTEYGYSITKAAISKYEREQSTPPGRFFIATAHILRIPNDYFFAEPDIHIDWLGFRKHAVLPQREQEEVKAFAHHQVESFLSLRQILQSREMYHIPLVTPITTILDAEKCAEHLRCEWGLDDNPIESVTQLIEDHGGIVLQWKADGDDFDGLSGWVNNQIPLVISRRETSDDRHRFTVSHELGHILMTSSTLDQKEFERAAHRFASAMLLPANALRHELGEHRRTIDIEELAVIKQKYGLSMQAIAYRSCDLGIIATSTKEWIFRVFSQRNWRKKEPYPFQGNEKPLKLQQLTLHAHAEGLISRSRVNQISPGYLSEEDPLHSPRAVMRLSHEERLHFLMEHEAYIAQISLGDPDLHVFDTVDMEGWDILEEIDN